MMNMQMLRRAAAATQARTALRAVGAGGRVQGIAAAIVSLEWAPALWCGDRELSTVTRIQGVRSLSTAASASAKAAAVSEDAREALVTQLRPLCRALYSEHRASTTTADLLAQWQSQISTLLQGGSNPLLITEIQHTYEQGVAIAFKQREFELAQALIAQMKQLGVAANDALYVYQIRAVPLQWISGPRPLALDELRELDLGSNWEHSLLELVRTENQPHYRKSAVERAQFQDQVRDGIAAILAAYEADVPKAKQTISPYNAALRTYASNGMAFAQMLRVLNTIPKDSKARTTLNAETFLALLDGARWHDIPLTIERLVKSNVLRELQGTQGVDGDDLAQRRSRTTALIWDQAMRAICNSYTERFFDKRTPIDKRRMRDLQNIFLDVEAQLLRVFPDETFTSLNEHNAVYEIRIKAAAWLGLPRQVHSLLNEYKALAPVEVASGQVGKSVFLKALEIFPSVGLKRVAPSDIERVRTLREVAESPEVAELKRSLEDLSRNVIPSKKKLLEDAQAKGVNVDDDERLKNVGRDLRKAHQNVTKLRKRLQDATWARAVEVAHTHRMRAADRSIDIILEHLVVDNKSADPRKDLDIAVAVMNQYMTTANRFVTRMNQQTRELMAAEIMQRVFALLDTAVGSESVVEAASEDELAKVKQLFSLATKTAALFWCEEDVERLLRRKKTALGTDRLDADDYDRLVFLRVAQLDLGGAYNLLQKMHYAGTSPTPMTIHRVVTGVLHGLYRPRGSSKNKAKATVDDDEFDDDDGDDDDDKVGSDNETSEVSEGYGDVQEDEEASAQSWSNGPSRLEDIPSFIQEWYNLYRVKPLAKTVVPVFARLLAANNVWEVKRLLQILDSMDGGLSPVTEFWLEKRLAAIGKSVDDLRYTAPKR